MIPVGNLRQVNISEIKRDKERFRQDFSGLEALCESIKEKGVLQPITLTSDLHILAGERRIKAAELAGLVTIPALIREIDGEIDAREIELIENIERKDFSWQEQCNLLAEIDKLYKGKEIDWSGRKTAQLIGKSTANVQKKLEMARNMAILPELANEATFDDAYKMVKKMEESIIVGELVRRQQEALNEPEGITNADYASGMHFDTKTKLRIADGNYNIGDTFLGLAELRSEGLVHIIECDPPYGINLNEQKSTKDNPTSTVTGYNEVPADQYREFLTKLSTELYRVAARDAWLIFWFGPTWHYEVRESLKTAGWQVDDIPCIWSKGYGQSLQPELYLARTYEPFFLCRKGNPAMAVRGHANVFTFTPTAGKLKYHPTERPLPLIEELLKILSFPGQTILVPFLGSGATLRACYKVGRGAFGWDISDEYKPKFMLAVEEDCNVTTMEEV